LVAEPIQFEAIELHLDGWTLVHTDQHRRQWMRDAEGDQFASSLTVIYQAEPLEGIDFNDYEAVRAAVSGIAAQAGQTVVSVEMIKAAGQLALWYILKQKQALSGTVYSGCMLLPFEACFITLQLVCLETGITGIREAIVMDRLIAKGTAIKELSQGQLAENGTAKARYSSDAEGHDNQFLNHPLSRVRRYFSEIIAKLSIPGML